MRYACEHCGTSQVRGFIPSWDHRFRVAVFHGIGIGLCGGATKTLFRRLGYSTEGWVHGPLSLLVCAVFLILYYGIATSLESWFISRSRRCLNCGRLGLRSDLHPGLGAPAAVTEIVVGGLYASRRNEGDYLIVKVLALDDYAVHLRSYANRFKEIPASISSSELSLGGIGSPEGFGIGHFPLDRRGFDAKTYTLVARETVCEEELEGYRMWQAHCSGDVQPS